ncbi:MAG: hypothetical protein KF740_15705 [Ramlibacter sp.]|nr:hypothetical protein [Ramlibacter sp.]
MLAANIAANDGSLVITGPEIGSDNVTALFEAYLPDGTLTIDGAVPGLFPGGQLGGKAVPEGATVSGTGGAGPFQDMHVTLVLSPQGNDVVLQLLAVAQTGWTFATSFGRLADTLFADLAFASAPCYYFASQNEDDFQEGLFFQGDLRLTGALANSTWLLGDPSMTTVTVAGPVQMHQSYPEIALSATMASGAVLGWFNIEPVTLKLTSHVNSVRPSGRPVLSDVMQLATSIRFSTGSTDLTIPLSADFYGDSPVVQFTADLTNMVYLGFNQLQSLVNDCDLSSVQFPSNFDLSQALGLATFALQVNLAAESWANKVFNVIVGVRSAQAWPLLTDPTYGTALAIDQIEVSFSVRNPMTSPRIGAAVFGLIHMSETGVMGLSAVYDNNFAVSGELLDGTTINLTQLAAYFMDTPPNPDVPPMQVVGLTFEAAPSSGDYALSVKVEDVWQLSLGTTQLSIDKVAFAMSTSQAGTQVRLGGAARIGPALIALDWQLPGTFSLNGVIPKIPLSEMVASLSPTAAGWVNSFPTIQLLNTTVAVQRFQDGGYFLAAGTHVENFGAFEVQFSEIARQTGFTFGFALDPDWRLTQLSTVFDVALLRDIRFRNASLIGSSNDNPNFSFSSLAPVQLPPSNENAGRNSDLAPIAPSQVSGGVHAGLYLYADVVLDPGDPGPMGAVAKLLSGLDALTLSLAVPANYRDTVFVARIASHYQMFSTLTLDSVSVTIRPFQTYLSLATDVTVDLFGHSLGLSGAMTVAGADVELSLRTTTAWVEPFGIRGLTLQAVAVGFVLDNLAVSLQGQVLLGSGSRAISLAAAMEFSLAEEIPDLFMVEEVGTISLADIIGAFVASNHVPATLSQIELFSFRFLIVVNPVGWTDLITQKHYGAGLAFSGRLRVCNLVGSVDVQVDYATGIHATGQLDGPLVIGHVVTLTNATDPTRGAYLQVNSSQSPYVSMSLALTLFEIQRLQLLAVVSSNAFTVNFSTQLSGVSALGRLSVNASLVNGNRFDFNGQCSMTVPRVKSIKAGGFTLGSLSGGLSAAAGIGLVFGPSAAMAMTLSGDFTLGGVHMTLSPCQVSVNAGSLTSFASIPGYFAGVLKDTLWQVGAALFQNADALFRYVRAEGLYLASDISHILSDVLHIDINAAAQYLKSATQFMQYSVTEIGTLLKSGYNASAQLVGAALKSARYAATEIAAAVGAIFRLGAESVANVLKAIGCSLGDIATVLRQIFGYSAKEVAEFFKKAWNVVDELVADALDLAGYAANKIEDAMSDVYHWAKKKWDEFTDAINPSNW